MKIYPTIRSQIFFAFLKLFYIHAFFSLCAVISISFFSLYLSGILSALFLLSLPLFFSFSEKKALDLSRPFRDFTESIQNTDLKKITEMPTPLLELFLLKKELEKMLTQTDQLTQSTKKNALEQSLFFEALLSSSQESFLFLDKNRRVFNISPFLLHLLELPKEQVFDYIWDDLSSMTQEYLDLRSLLKTDFQQTVFEITKKSSLLFSIKNHTVSSFQQEFLGSLYILSPLAQNTKEPAQISIERKKVFLIPKMKFWISLLKKRAEKNHVLLDFQTSLDSDFCVQIDENSFFWIISSFILNTLFFAQDAVIIRINLTKNDKDMELTLIDENLMKVIENEKTLFTLTKEGETTNTPKAIFELNFDLAQKIMQAHNGSIECFRMNEKSFGIQLKLAHKQDEY